MQSLRHIYHENNVKQRAVCINMKTVGGIIILLLLGFYGIKSAPERYIPNPCIRHYGSHCFRRYPAFPQLAEIPDRLLESLRQASTTESFHEDNRKRNATANDTNTQMEKLLPL